MDSKQNISLFALSPKLKGNKVYILRHKVLISFMLTTASQGTFNSLGHKGNQKYLEIMNLCNVSALSKWAPAPQYHQPVSSQWF